MPQTKVYNVWLVIEEENLATEECREVDAPGAAARMKRPTNSSGTFTKLLRRPYDLSFLNLVPSEHWNQDP
jgi:hypothetical protein